MRKCPTRRFIPWIFSTFGVLCRVTLLRSDFSSRRMFETFRFSSDIERFSPYYYVSPHVELSSSDSEDEVGALTKAFRGRRAELERPLTGLFDAVSRPTNEITVAPAAG